MNQRKGWYRPQDSADWHFCRLVGNGGAALVMCGRPLTPGGSLSLYPPATDVCRQCLDAMRAAGLTATGNPRKPALTTTVLRGLQELATCARIGKEALQGGQLWEDDKARNRAVERACQWISDTAAYRTKKGNGS